MAINNKIQTSELDFDAIKENFKEYLRGQSQFSDYDFEGSGLSVLLDILAYNTHYNALYHNLAVNEAFLDSASKRASVISKAKELGYVPGSAKSASAVVTVTAINEQVTAPAVLELPKYSIFSTLIDSEPYTFYTTESYIAYREEDQYIFEDVTIREGTQLELTTIIDSQTSVIIPNQNVDTSTLRVVVQENAQSSVYTVFSESKTVLNVDGTTPVYFIKETDGGLYEIEFGNGVVGKPLVPGNIVTIEYIVCNGSAANGARSFRLNTVLAPDTESFVTTQTEALGGAEAESIDSVKWNAPRMYATQNRCVTAEDYKSLIAAYYPGIKTIAVWGGENNTPPEYGKVYISVVPTDTDYLSEVQKQYILDTIINPRKAIGTTPVFIDPTYLKLQLSVAFYYNPALTNRNIGDLTTIVRQTILDYDTKSLKTFGDVFKMSNLSSLIDAAEPAIVSNIITLKLLRDVDPIYNITSGYTINIGNPIYNSGVAEQSITTTGVYTSETEEICYIEDQPVSESSDIGKLRLFNLDTNGNKIYLRDIGSVDYTQGILTITDLNITGLYGTTWTFVIKPQSNDVVSSLNQFAEIDATLLTITPVLDTPTKTYTFTSSRN